MKSAIIKATVQSLIVCLFLVGIVLPGLHVSAALRFCHTDPILTFSDGTKLTVTATIETDESNVISVVYTVHAPAGLTLDNTVYTAGGLDGDEKVVFVADQKPGIYRIETVVTTQAKGVHVSTNSSTRTVEGSADGTSGDRLVVTLNTAVVTATIPTIPLSASNNLKKFSSLK